MHYRLELEQKSVFAVQTSADLGMMGNRKASSRQQWQTLFGKEVTFTVLSKALSQDGWEVRSTRLTESFPFKAYPHLYEDRVIPLFAINPKGGLMVFSAEENPFPQPGWTVIGLVPPVAQPAVPWPADKA